MSEHDIEAEDLLITILLSESTKNLLGLKLPYVEDINEYDGHRCVIKPLNQDEVNLGKENPCFVNYFSSESDDEDKEEYINIEEAYFSDDFRSDSELSFTTFEDNENSADYLHQPNIMKLYTRPLMIAKCSNNENTISLEQNNILINISVDQLSLSSNDSLICRICHGGDSIGDLLAPCRCKGSIAFAHIECLEHWLKESSNSYCELCKHHFDIIREPRYTLLKSICAFLRNPGDDLRDLLLDLFSFIVYTPSAIVTTYLLMITCESITHGTVPKNKAMTSHIVAFFAVFGMAAIDFTYSSWLILTYQKHRDAWKTWYRNNSSLRLILPEWKSKPYKKSTKKQVEPNANNKEIHNCLAFY